MFVQLFLTEVATGNANLLQALYAIFALNAHYAEGLKWLSMMLRECWRRFESLMLLLRLLVKIFVLFTRIPVGHDHVAHVGTDGNVFFK